MISHNQKIHILRLHPGQDLKRVLFDFVQSKQIGAAAIVAAVGSLSKAQLRLASAQKSVEWAGPFEVVSLSGTLAMEGLHLHISLADASGVVCGGHLLDGCLVHTTCELVIQQYLDLEFHRQVDSSTGYKELSISERR
jgi:predicted DNA-binding protein with PD1-like motif